MTTQDKTRSDRPREKPEGAQPTRKSEREDERVRKEGEAEGGGDAPMDPADEKVHRIEVTALQTSFRT